MLSFESDYIMGAHPEVLRRLAETNFEPLPGYGSDIYSESAAAKIREACRCPDADVRFLTGGTQTNQVIISTMLQPYEGVIAATTGHVSAHEAGAIESTGHKVLTLPEHDGKLDAGEVKSFIETFYADANHSHMVYPGMVYISHPTEYGTLYTKDEEMLAMLGGFGAELNTVFIVSGVKIECSDAPAGAHTEGLSGVGVLVEPADGCKCDRCWSYSTKGESTEDGGFLCDRCKSILL